MKNKNKSSNLDKVSQNAEYFFLKFDYKIFFNIIYQACF